MVLVAEAEMVLARMVDCADPALLLLVVMVLLALEMLLADLVSLADLVLLPFVVGLAREAEAAY